jgi:hypothetical protein
MMGNVSSHTPPPKTFNVPKLTHISLLFWLAAVAIQDEIYFPVFAYDPLL